MVQIQLFIEHRAGDAQQPRGLRVVAAGGLKGLTDQAALHVLLVVAQIELGHAGHGPAGAGVHPQHSDRG